MSRQLRVKGTGIGVVKKLILIDGLLIFKPSVTLIGEILSAPYEVLLRTNHIV